MNVKMLQSKNAYSFMFFKRNIILLRAKLNILALGNIGLALTKHFTFYLQLVLNYPLLSDLKIAQCGCQADKFISMRLSSTYF